MALDTTPTLQPSAIQSAALSIVQKRINKHIQALREKHRRILQLEESLSQGKHLIEEEQEALRSNHIVFGQTELLEKLLEEFSANASAADAAVKEADVQDAPAGSVDEQGRGAAEDLSKAASLVPMPVKNQERSSKERYLCISDGFIIYCLDLEEGRADQPNDNCSDIPPLPKTSAIKLPEKGLPILSGLLKLGSDAYIIGGRKFESFEKDPHHWFMDIFRSFTDVLGLHGTPRVAYRLSLVDGSLSCLNATISSH